MHFVYLIQSLKDSTFYIGQTADLKERLRSHNAGENLSTKSKKPWRLVYCECFKDKRDALDREKKLKNHGKGISELKKRLKYSAESDSQKK